MKKCFYLFIIFGIFSCSTKDDHRIKQFEKTLGKQQSRALTKVVENFELFLRSNFPNPTLQESYEAFLINRQKGNYNPSEWNYEGINFEELKNLYETSGLRQEIFLKRDSICFPISKVSFEDKMTISESLDWLISCSVNPNHFTCFSTGTVGHFADIPSGNIDIPRAVPLAAK